MAIPCCHAFRSAVACHNQKSAFHSTSAHALALTFFLCPLLWCSLKLREDYIDVSLGAGHSTVVNCEHFWRIMSLCITHCKQTQVFLLTKWPTERNRHGKFLHSSNTLQSLCWSRKDFINLLNIVLLTYSLESDLQNKYLCFPSYQELFPLSWSVLSLWQPRPYVLKIDLLLWWITCRWMHSDKPTNCIDSLHS